MLPQIIAGLASFALAKASGASTRNALISGFLGGATSFGIKQLTTAAQAAGAAGTAYTDKIEDRSIPPNYFLWADNPKEIAKSLNKHNFDIHDTVGPESLTKGELTIFINSLTNS